MKKLFLMLCICICTAFISKAQPFLSLHNHFGCDDIAYVLYAENSTCGGPGTYVSNVIILVPGEAKVFDFSGGPGLPGFWNGTAPSSPTFEFVKAEVSIVSPSAGVCNSFPYDMVTVDNPICLPSSIANFVLSTTAGGTPCAVCPSASPTIVNVQFNVPGTITSADWEVLVQ